MEQFQDMTLYLVAEVRRVLEIMGALLLDSS